MRIIKVLIILITLCLINNSGRLYAQEIKPSTMSEIMNYMMGENFELLDMTNDYMIFNKNNIYFAFQFNVNDSLYKYILYLQDGDKKFYEQLLIDSNFKKKDNDNYYWLETTNILAYIENSKIGYILVFFIPDLYTKNKKYN